MFCSYARICCHILIFCVCLFFVSNKSHLLTSYHETGLEQPPDLFEESSGASERQRYAEVGVRDSAEQALL